MAAPGTFAAGEHGLVRLAAAVPHQHLADPVRNAAETIALAEEAAAAGAVVVAFPELGLTGYANDDLFGQRALQRAAEAALATVTEASAGLAPLLVVGLPLLVGSRLFNVAAVVHRGRVLGVVPKSYLPGYREFYEPRQFVAARAALEDAVRLAGEVVPFGADLLFACEDVEHLVVHIEVCEDLWVPVAPSAFAAMAGATVLLNLSASNATIGKAAYRRELCSSQSARLIAAHVYASAGFGESTTDLAWDGHAMVHENGSLLAESRRFADVNQLVSADVDLERLVLDRSRMNSYHDCATDHADRSVHRVVAFGLGDAPAPLPLQRRIDRYPFIPVSSAGRDERCEEAYRIQVQGLTTRLSATGIERVVLGISGGLDSAQALLVACRAMDALELPRTNVLGYTMPGFATTSGTRTDAHRLMEALGITGAEIDIRPSATQMLRDLGHPAADGEPVYDITYENVQAGERTSHLFRLANHHGALVVGTGDLSELALGWCTYGVGDQMAHYNVNSSVPKTLMQDLVRWTASQTRFGPEATAVLLQIVDREISPELVPGDAEDTIGQRTEDLVGPYDLHDFFLHATVRLGFTPAKIAFLARQAWSDPEAGEWPASIPEPRRRGYSGEEIDRWLEVFLRRFFATSQFKRSAMPNGPKIGSVSLSPRGDWRAPSDSAADTWLASRDQGRFQ
jgi:NAD+ synthase (glutamine-hydrolysing)